MSSKTIIQTHGLRDKWRGQTNWQLDGWKNHIKVQATQAIIQSSLRIIFVGWPFQFTTIIITTNIFVFHHR
ncbi:RCC1 and BTB domain-containing protein 2, variant 2 [Dermatophagoides farinae]|uniref:RCC1 and BTB domain-containing protein 2, variant 2 n=1 Tax=Dermatophagoides farinae TaxID=6954 RepID=A0A922IFG3_DERFA|nr:RCC1 and BTB domain-containing protein 2, variant 2 [Dermatophagoides farinae]